MRLNDFERGATWRPNGALVRAGVSRCDITPVGPIRAKNWGAGASDVAAGVHRPLTATVLCLSPVEVDVPDAARPRYLISLDLGWLCSSRHDSYLRLPIVASLGAQPDDVLFHLTHTHSGPSTNPDDLDLPGGDLVADYVERIVRDVVQCARTARDSAAVTEITWAYGRCDIATGRDISCEGVPVVGFDPERRVDDTVAVGRLTSIDGAVRAVLVNYACHPTTLAWQNTALSPDYVGAAREVIETATGALCLFLQGASGDLAPREQYVGDPEVADRHGLSLGHAVLSSLASMARTGTGLKLSEILQSGAPLARWTQSADTRSTRTEFARLDIELELVPELGLVEASRRWPVADERVVAERVRRASRLRESWGPGPNVDYPVWLWRLGDAILVAHPGEAYSSFQLELRRRYPGWTVLVLNLTNGPASMYLPPPDLYSLKTYQSWQTLWAPGSAERLLAGADRAMKELVAGRESANA